jgi:Polyketide synthesis cyclase
MSTNLIVARMDPGSAEEVARIFGESDRTPLPGLVGVQRRQLFRYHGLYLHLFETDEGTEPGAARVDRVRDHALFLDVNERLARHVTAYDPQTWQAPRDAMAELFYSWRAPA